MASLWDKIKNVAYTAVTGKNRNMPSAESAVAGNLVQQGNKIVVPQAPKVNARQLQQSLQQGGSTAFGRTLNNSIANGNLNTEHMKAYKQMRMADLHARYKAGQIGQQSYQAGVDALLNNTFSPSLPDPVQTNSPLQKVVRGGAQIVEPFVNVAKTGVEGARANLAQVTRNPMAQDAAMTRYNDALSKSFVGGPASRLVNYAVGSTFGKNQEALNQKLAESIAQNDITAQKAYKNNPTLTVKSLKGSSGQTLSNLDLEARARGRQLSPTGGVLAGAEFGLDVGSLGLGTLGKQAVKMGVNPILARLTENGLQGALGNTITAYLQNPDFNPASKEGVKNAGLGFATGALAGEAIPLATKAYASMPNLAQELKNSSPQAIAHIRLLQEDPSYSALAVEHAQARTSLENAQANGVQPPQSLLQRVAGLEQAMAQRRVQVSQGGYIKNPLAKDPLESLKQESIKAYHGSTNDKLTKLEPGAKNGLNEKRNLIYLSEDKNAASNYAKNRGAGGLGKLTDSSTGRVYEVNVNGKVLDAYDRTQLDAIKLLPDYEQLSGKTKNMITNDTGLSSAQLEANPELVQFLKTNGIVAVRSALPNGGKATELAVVDPSKINLNNQATQSPLANDAPQGKTAATNPIDINADTRLTEITKEINAINASVKDQASFNSAKPKLQALQTEAEQLLNTKKDLRTPAPQGKPSDQSPELTSPTPTKKLSSIGQSTKSPKVVLKTSSNDVIPQNVKDVTSVLNGQEVKERGFAKTVRTADKTPAMKSIEDGTYVVKSDKQRIADARQFIKENPKVAEELALNPQSDMHVTIGNQLLDSYIATGKIEKFRALNSGMAKSGTELGRAVHAFADYNKTTPSGAVRFAEKTIKQYNKQHPDNPLTLSTDDVNGLVKKAQSIQKMPEGRERNIATQELMKDINKLVPSTIADKAITVWKAGLLTSPRTTLRNVVGNTVHGVTEAIKDIPASLNDMLLKQRTGKRSLTMTLKGTASGAKIGFKNSKDIMKYGFDPEDSISKFDVKKVTWGENKTEQALKSYTEFVFNFLGAQDKPFYHSAFARSLYDQAGAEAINVGKKGDKAFIQNLVENPTEKMKINATKDASVATFKNQNLMSEFAGKFKQTFGKTEKGKIFSEVVAPFTGVPSSIAGQILAYSPVGLAKGVSKDIKILAKNMPELQRQASQEIGRGVVGSGLMGIGAYLTAQGLMTGNPKDAKEAKQWELEGKQANSVLINGKWRSINSVGPEALVVLAGSKIQSGKGNGASAVEIGANLGRDFTSQTFLQGVQGPLNAVADPNRYGDSYIRGQAASVVPNIVKDTAKAFDGKQRQTNSVSDAVKAGIPGLRNTLLAKQDSLGNDLKQEPTGVNAYVDLFNSKTPTNNPVVKEIGRLKDTGNEVIPSTVDKSVKIDGTKVDLTPQQRTDLQKSIGQTTQDYWGKTISTPAYKSLSPEEQSRVLQNIKDDIRSAELRKFSSDNSLGQYDPNFNGKSTTPSEKIQKILNDEFNPADYTATKKPSVKATKTPKIANPKTKKVSSGSKSKKAKVAKLKLGKIKTSVKMAKMPRIGKIRSTKIKTPKLSKGRTRKVKIA